MTRRYLRLLILATLIGLSIGVAATGAAAAELEEYLTRADEAFFAGRQATWSSYGGQTEFSVVAVEQAGEVWMVENAGSSEMTGGGRNSDIGGSGIAIAAWSSQPGRSRYATGNPADATRLGRDVVVIDVTEGDLVRARIWFDEETGAALGSEIYDGSGGLFRLSWMLDFDPNPRKIFTMMREVDSTYDLAVPSAADGVAESLAGYDRVDTYAGPNEWRHAFYADGLFSFSLFSADGQVADGPFAEADKMQVAGADYRWILTPSDVWVRWNGDGMTYVLVGDLPPDHLEQVLEELPQPASTNIFSRIWRGLFG